VDEDGPRKRDPIRITLTTAEFLYVRNGLAALMNSGYPEDAVAEIQALDARLKEAAGYRS
jgi:hypothetical protein